MAYGAMCYAVLTNSICCCVLCSTGRERTVLCEDGYGARVCCYAMLLPLTLRYAATADPTLCSYPFCWRSDTPLIYKVRPPPMLLPPLCYDPTSSSPCAYALSSMLLRASCMLLPRRFLCSYALCGTELAYAATRCAGGPRCCADAGRLVPGGVDQGEACQEQRGYGTALSYALTYLLRHVRTGCRTLSRKNASIIGSWAHVTGSSLPAMLLRACYAMSGTDVR
eukprot:1764869-Rhodomonas_salina.2